MTNVVNIKTKIETLKLMISITRSKMFEMPEFRNRKLEKYSN